MSPGAPDICCKLFAERCCRIVPASPAERWSVKRVRADNNTNKANINNKNSSSTTAMWLGWLITPNTLAFQNFWMNFLPLEAIKLADSGEK